jgi:cytochrome c-type biogenesis protein CcmH
MTPRRAVWVLLAIVVGVMVVVLVSRGGDGHPSPEARAQRLERELACPVCTGESVAESNVPESRAIKAEIRDDIRAGRSDRQIRDAYVATYGERILLTPDSGGLGVIAWGLPVLVLVAGLGGLTLALYRWSHLPRLQPTAEDERLVDAARADGDEPPDSEGDA